MSPREAARRSGRPGSRRASAVTPARLVAFAVIRRVFESGAWADRALEAEAGRAGLDARERALATRLAFEVVQRRATLDHLASLLAGRPVDRLDPAVLAALRLGLVQLAFLDGIAPHAAVDQSVELAKPASPGGARLVNAVLRRAVAEAPDLLAALGDEDPESAALRHSLPEWVVRMWWECLGPAQARALARAANEPAEHAVRANALLATAAEVRAGLAARGVAAGPAPGMPEGLVLRGPFDVHGSDLYEAGALMPQSRAAMLVARALEPRPGEVVLDLCAAPGGKATHLAALTGREGRVVAVERRPARAAALRRTVARMRAGGIVSVLQADAAALSVSERFDAALADPPCSGLGTLRSRPDIRWRADPGSVEGLARAQRAILLAGARALRPGGRVVYATCTISPRENEGVIAAALDADPGLEVDDLGAASPGLRHPADPRFLLTLPHRDGTDGFFISRLRRTLPPAARRIDAP